MVKNKHLVLLFLGILAGGLALRRISFSPKKDFQREILGLDTAAINQIVLLDPTDRSSLVLDRSGGAWVITSGKLAQKIRGRKMDTLLAPFTSLHSLKIVAKSQSEWPAYNLTEKTGFQLLISSEGKKMEVLTLGKTALENGQKISFLRLADSEEVFAVEGDLAEIWRLKFDDFRAQHFFKPPSTPAVAATFLWKDHLSFFLEKSGEKWLTPGGFEAAADDEMQVFLKKLAALPVLGFADDFDVLEKKDHFFAQIELETTENDSAPAVILSCFKPQNQPGKMVLYSSQNPENYLLAADSLAEKLFLQPLLWMQEEAKKKHEN